MGEKAARNRAVWRARGLRRRAKIALAAAGALALAFSGFTLANEVAVQLGPTGPQPETVTVNWGDTVVFTNSDAEPHTILIPEASVTSPDIPQGGTFQHVFDQKKGAFSYVQTGTKRYLGRVVVQLQGLLTLKATPAKVVFGQSAMLTGVSPYPNSPVVISQRPVGSQTETQLLTVTAASDGSYAASFPPQSGTRVRARAAAGQLRSPLVAVAVAPRLTVTARPTTVKAGRTVTVTGRVAPTSAARTVHLDHYNSRRGAWDSVSTKPVSNRGEAVFRWKAEEGRSLLRLRLTRTDVQTGYQPTISRSVAVGSPTARVALRLTISARPTTQKVGRTVTVTGRVTPADAARRVRLERYNPQRKVWDSLGAKAVSNGGAAVFRWRAKKGRSLLRLRTTRADVQPGYQPTTSRWVAVEGRAP